MWVKLGRSLLIFYLKQTKTNVSLIKVGSAVKWGHISVRNNTGVIIYSSHLQFIVAFQTKSIYFSGRK